MALAVKNLPANAGDFLKDSGLIPGLGRSPVGGHSNPLQYSCLENPMDRGAWQAAVHRVTPSRTWLSTHACRLHYVTKNFSFICQSSTSYKESQGKLCPSHHASRRLLPPLWLPCLILFILAAIYTCHFNRMSQSGSPSNVRTVSQKSKMIVKSQTLLIKITSKLTQSLLLCLEQI